MGPGPSSFAARLIGAMPFFAGEQVEVLGTSHGAAPSGTSGQAGWYGARSVSLYLLGNVQNAVSYGKSQLLARCVRGRGVLLGNASVDRGRFTWSGALPRLRPGSNWSLIALASNGTYYIETLSAPGAATPAIVAPYELVAGPAVDGLPAPDTGVANDDLRIVGLRLPANGRFTAALVGTPPGSRSPRSMTLGEVRVTGGRLDATFPLYVVQAGAGAYQLLLLRGHDVAYSLPIRILPPPKVGNQAPPPTPAAYLHMTSAAAGYAVYGNRLLRTTDGGRTWINVTPPGVQLGYLASEAGLPQEPAWFLGQDDVWLWVPRVGQAMLYRSTDAGAKWSQSAVSISGVRELDFLTASDGYALAGFNSLYRTSDGGRTWQAVRGGGLPQASDGIGFVSASVGWAATQTDGGQTPLLVTRDGGATWSKNGTPALPVASSDALMGMAPAVFPGGSSVVAVVDWMSRKLYFLTSAGASAAMRISTPIEGGKAFTPPLYSFSSPQDGIAWMGVSLKVTRDGGRAWTTLALPQPLQDFWNSWPQLDAVSPHSVFALVHRNGAYFVLSSPNFGSTWSLAGSL